MMMENTHSTASGTAQNSDRVLVIERIFDAPRELVFKAWTEPERQVQWLGPQGFTGKILQAAQKPGDAYRYYMRDPQGGDHWQQGVLQERVEPHRLKFTYEWANDRGEATRPQTMVTVTFEDVGGKTRLTLRQEVFESATACDDHRNGWNSSLDRMAETLKTAR
jgi:uncharacterized protein YndB with AHSA1/START domain